MRDIQEISLQTLKSIGTSASYGGSHIQACNPAETDVGSVWDISTRLHVEKFGVTPWE